MAELVIASLRLQLSFIHFKFDLHLNYQRNTTDILNSFTQYMSIIALHADIAELAIASSFVGCGVKLSYESTT